MSAYVCASTQKSAINFGRWQHTTAKFLGDPKLIASNFLEGESDTEAHGVRPGQQNMGFLPNLSPPRVLM